MFFEMRSCLGILESGERSLPFGLLVKLIPENSSWSSVVNVRLFFVKGARLQIDVRFQKALAQRASLAAFELALLLINWPGNQYNMYMYMYVVAGEMMKQTSLTI